MGDLERSSSEVVERMGVFGFMKSVVKVMTVGWEKGAIGLMIQAVKLMRRNFSLFFGFVAAITMPCSIFTVLLMSAVDLHRSYAISDFISNGKMVIFGWEFEAPILHLDLNVVFIILSLLHVAVLNTAVCSRAVVTTFKKKVDLSASIKSSYIGLHWPVLRLLATQSMVLCIFALTLVTNLLLESGSSSSHAPSSSSDAPSSDGDTVCKLLSFIILYLLFVLPVS